MADPLFASDLKGASERATGFGCATIGDRDPRHNPCVPANLNPPNTGASMRHILSSLRAGLLALRVTAGR
jgi:hypothetical protein